MLMRGQWRGEVCLLLAGVLEKASACSKMAFLRLLHLLLESSPLCDVLEAHLVAQAGSTCEQDGGEGAGLEDGQHRHAGGPHAEAAAMAAAAGAAAPGADTR